MGPETMTDRWSDTRRAWGGDRDQVGTVPGDRVARGVGLRAWERADGIDEAPAGSEELGTGDGDRDLETCQA